MQSVELNVSKRDGGTPAKVLRRDGIVPGVFYGAGSSPVAVEVDAKEFRRRGRTGHGAHLIRFVSEESRINGALVLVREIQAHPVSGSLVHIDFLRLDPNKPVQTEVALNYTGKAEGVVAGGILQPIRRDLEVRALPDKLPDSIEIDVTALDIHDSIHIEDLSLPEGVEAIYHENFTLITVVPPVVEVVEEPVDEELEEGAEAAEGEGAEGEPAAEGAEASGEASSENSGGKTSKG